MSAAKKAPKKAPTTPASAPTVGHEPGLEEIRIKYVAEAKAAYTMAVDAGKAVAS